MIIGTISTVVTFGYGNLLLKLKSVQLKLTNQYGYITAVHFMATVPL